MEKDSFPILGIDHLEIYVGSARQMAHYLCSTFGFTEIAHHGLEKGKKTNRVSYVLAQGNIRLVVSGSLTADSDIVEHVLKHGDGVKDIALTVPDCAKAYRHAVVLGGLSLMAPRTYEDENGEIRYAAIRTYGDTIHSLIERKNYRGIFLPGYKPSDKPKEEPVGLLNVDHIVGNVELGKMNVWVDYYSRVMGFTNLVHYTDNQISTEYTSLMSKVMWDGTGKVKFPINEPAPSKRKSQIDEYLEFYGGAGVQHVALETDSIIKTVSRLKRRGVKFLEIPRAYYDGVREKFADLKEVDVEDLARYGILADRDEEGYLLQIFTQPIVDRPTLFFEIIERQGSRGFGLGNFKALFEALEREQDKRGTL